MGYGGARPGAGRKPGKRNHNTLALMAKAEAADIGPFDALLYWLGFFHRESLLIAAEINKKPVNAEDAAGMTARTELAKQLSVFTSRTLDFAAEALPYIKGKMPNQDAPKEHRKVVEHHVTIDMTVREAEQVYRDSLNDIVDLVVRN